MAAFSKLVSKVTSPGNSALLAISAVGFWMTLRKLYKKSNRGNNNKDVQFVIGDQQKKKERAAVDVVFFKRMARILKILIPGFFNIETWYILMVAISLGARTVCDVWMIQNGTSIESAIIGRNMGLFKTHLFQFLYAMPVISVVNNILKYGLNELKLRFRTRLSRHLYRKYLQGFTYYQMSNLDNRISNADQLLTQDVEKLSESVGELYSNLSKPLLDIAIYATKLSNAIGVQGPIYMIGYLFVAGFILTNLRRPIGRLTVREQKLEGELRYVHSRLITNSEEIAFYQGNDKEKKIVNSVFERLVDHLKNFIFFRFSMGLIDDIIAKYLALTVGFLVVSRPFFDMEADQLKNSTHSERLQNYYRSGRMLVKMAEAIGRIVLAGREMTRLAGFTARVTEFMKVLDDLNGGKYERTMVTAFETTDSKHQPGGGKIIKKDHIIKFENVPLLTPNGNVLVKELNFEVKSGVNVLVCGPNGCGKSSLFRILGELWPMFGGTLTKPESGQLFYIPQRPYMTLGTLRDQVIYPDTKDAMLKKGITDKDLEDILSKVQLSYILEREGGWDSVQDWMDVLSGGEKQRVAMSRLFVHKPQFAILDECTSAVSVDVEGYMYQHCREVGITLFTVSHRKSLWKHHEYYLHMDGRGSFEFKKITQETVEFGS